MTRLLTATEHLTDYQTRLLFSDLFDGFILFLAVLILVMILIFSIPRYRKNPTAKRRGMIKGVNVALTVVGSLFLMEKLDILAFLFNPYDYITSSTHISGGLANLSARNAYIAMYALYIIVLTAAIIVCVIGYRTLTDKALKQAAFRVAHVTAPANPQFKACSVCGFVVNQFVTTCHRCGADSFVSSDTENTQQQQVVVSCPSCNTVNPANATFCQHCGNKLS